MIEKRQVMYDIGRCICHVPDACRDCSHYKHGEYLDCMEELLKAALAMLEEQPEIIMCKDCKLKDRCEISGGFDGLNPDWFCADGIAKDNKPNAPRNHTQLAKNGET